MAGRCLCHPISKAQKPDRTSNPTDADIPALQNIAQIRAILDTAEKPAPQLGAADATFIVLDDVTAVSAAIQKS